MQQVWAELKQCSFSILICSPLSAFWCHTFKHFFFKCSDTVLTHTRYLGYPYNLPNLHTACHSPLFNLLIHFLHCLLCSSLFLVYCIYVNICLYKTIICIFMQHKMESYSSGLKLGKPNIKYKIRRLLNWNTLVLQCLNFHNYNCFRTLNILNFPGFFPQSYYSYHHCNFKFYKRSIWKSQTPISANQHQP